MVHRGPAFPLSHVSDQSTWLDEQLELVCRNLLKHPVDCRGPFVISDRELQAGGSQVSAKPIRLAVANTTGLPSSAL
jgi:hypothetical protein